MLQADPVDPDAAWKAFVDTVGLFVKFFPSFTGFSSRHFVLRVNFHAKRHTFIKLSHVFS